MSGTLPKNESSSSLRTTKATTPEAAKKDSAFSPLKMKTHISDDQVMVIEDLVCEGLDVIPKGTRGYIVFIDREGDANVSFDSQNELRCVLKADMKKLQVIGNSSITGLDAIFHYNVGDYVAVFSKTNNKWYRDGKVIAVDDEQVAYCVVYKEGTRVKTVSRHEAKNVLCRVTPKQTIETSGTVPRPAQTGPAATQPANPIANPAYWELKFLGESRLH